MATPVTINGQQFDYPVAGETPGWGAEAHDAFIALVDVVNAIQSPTDILLTQFDVPDNIATPTAVIGLVLDSSIRSADIYYSVYRTSNDHPSGHSETGKMLLINDSSAPSGSIWTLKQEFNGSAGMTFSVSDSGQVFFMSSQIDNGGGGYTGVMKFSAKTIGV